MQLRPYQLQCVEATLAAFDANRSALVVMPTGTGKTVTFAEIIRRMQSRGRAMVQAHREELIWQAAKKIHAVTGDQPDIEMAEFKADAGMLRRAHTIVASVQSLISGTRLNKFNPSDFGVVITDEAHHATADSYRRVFDYFHINPLLRHLGVTATPDRADEAALGQIYQCVAFVYELVNAINDGWLVPVAQRSVVVESLDYSNVRTTAGDLNQGDLAAVMEFEKNLQAVVDPAMALAAWRKTLIFATTVAQAERLAEIINRRRAGAAQWLCGKTPKEERKHILDAFTRGDFQFLVNVGVLTEGYDEPGVELIVMARPTKSRALFAQMVGRGTRPLPGLVDSIDSAVDRRAAIAASPKPQLEVLDFVGNTGRHKLVTTADILGGEYSDEEISKAEQIVKDAKGSAVGMLEALERAHSDLEAEKAAERAKRRSLVANTSYRVENVDPFDVFGIEAPRVRGWDVEPVSEKQAAILTNAGVKVDGMNKRQASALISEIFSRRESGQCTFKQAQLLTKHGYDASAMTFAEASKVIDGIVKAGWKRPEKVAA